MDVPMCFPVNWHKILSLDLKVVIWTTFTNLVDIKGAEENHWIMVQTISLCYEKESNKQQRTLWMN